MFEKHSSMKHSRGQMSQKVWKGDMTISKFDDHICNHPQFRLRGTWTVNSKC